MKKFLSNLFTPDNLLFGNIVVMLILALWSLEWKILFLPIVVLLVFCIGGIAQWVVNKFIKTK